MAFQTGDTVVQLDELDHRILAHLGEDGRRSNARIAAAEGVSKSTIKNRLDRLLRSGACRVLGVANPEKLGYGTVIYLGVKTEPAGADAVTEALMGFPEVRWVLRVTGRYDVFVEVALREPSSVFDVVVQRISVIPGIASIETFLATRQTWWRPIEWRPPVDGALAAQGEPWDVPRWRGTDASASGELGEVPGVSAPARLDAVDHRIIELLQEDGRRPAADIARALGVSKSTVKNRVDRLLAHGVFKVLGVVMPESLGYTNDVLMALTTEPSKTAKVGEALVGLPNVCWVCHVTGRYDILAGAWLRQGVDVFDFVARQVAPIPGVRSMETSGVTGDTKWRPMEWPLFAAALGA